MLNFVHGDLGMVLSNFFCLQSPILGTKSRRLKTIFFALATFWVSRSSLGDFGIFVFVFHVKTALGVEPKTTPGPGVVKKQNKEKPHKRAPCLCGRGSLPSFLSCCFVLFYFLVFMQVAATAPAQALPFRHREEFNALSQL